MSADIRIEFPSRGATYNRPVFGVYQYSEYESWSVLAGQEKRSFLASFETLEEAKAAYPGADESGCGFRDQDPGPVAPAWFDPTLAGERWDEEDS